MAIIQELATNKFGHYKIDKKAIATEIMKKNKIKANYPLLKKSLIDEDKLMEDL